MKKEYIVFSQKIAGELMMNGHVLKRMEKTNRDNSNRNVFIFNETSSLLEIVSKYQNK